MQVTTLRADRSVLEAALVAADNVATPPALFGLNAPSDGATLGRVEAAWETVKQALESAFEGGAEKARPLLEKAWQTIESVMQSAAHKAREVADMLRSRLRAYIAAFVDEMLRQVRSKIQVGDSVLRLSAVEVSQKLAMGGSLKASLTEAFELTADGEFEVSASYAVA